MSSRPPTISSAPSSTKRPDASSAALPKPSPCKIHSLALIAEKAVLAGPRGIEVGENSVIHPHAKILAAAGDVRIGRSCVVAEMAVVGGGGGGGGSGGPGNADEGDAEAGSGEGKVVLGDGVVVETGAVVQRGVRVGEGSVVEVFARVGAGARVGRFCKITPCAVVDDGEEVGDFVIVLGDGRRRMDRTLMEHEEVREAKVRGQDMHVELLKKLIVDGSAKWR